MVLLKKPYMKKKDPRQQFHVFQKYMTPESHVHRAVMDCFGPVALLIHIQDIWIKVNLKNSKSELKKMSQDYRVNISFFFFLAFIQGKEANGKKSSVCFYLSKH